MLFRSEVSVHYDPLIAKLIADGETRDIARRRAIEALRNYPILGIRTNLSLLIEILEHPRFVSGDIDTRFLESEGANLRARASSDVPAEAIEVAALLRSHATDSSRRSTGSEGGGAKADPWDTLRGYRG